MKRLLLFIITSLLIFTACSADTTVGELIDPNYDSNRRDNGVATTTTSDGPYIEKGVPDHLAYLLEHIDNFAEVGITLDYLEEYLNSLDYDVMDTDTFKWISNKYEELCEAEGRVPQVTYFPFIIGFVNEEAFYGPAIETNVNNIVTDSGIYTAEWVYRHTMKDYETAGITPEMIEEKIYYYQGFPFNGVAQPFFERKLSAYLGHDVSLEIDEERDTRGKGYDVIYNMPAPFGEDAMCAPQYWSLPVEHELDVPEYLSNLVSDEEWNAWVHSIIDHELGEYEYESLDTFVNVYSFVEYFDISSADVYEAYERPPYNTTEENRDYYGHLANYIATRYPYNIYRHYLDNYATIVVADRSVNFFTPSWLYYHSVAEWSMAGITPEIVEEKLEFYDDYDFTDNARTAFEYKLSWFLGYDVSLDKKQNFTTMIFDGDTYDIGWLSTHTVQEYQAEGITIDNLKIFLDYIQPYWEGTNEYDWIESAYLRMMDYAGR